MNMSQAKLLHLFVALALLIKIQVVHNHCIWPTWKNSLTTLTNLFVELIPSCTIYVYGEYNENRSPLLPFLYDICATFDFHQIKSKDNDFATCVQLITSKYVDDYIWEWTDFNLYHVRNKFQHFKNSNISTNSSRQDNGNGSTSISRQRSGLPPPFPPPPNLKPVGRDWGDGETEPYYSIFASKKFQRHCLILIRSSIKIDYRPYWQTRGFEGAFTSSDYLPVPYNGRISPDYVFIYAYNESLISCNPGVVLKGKGHNHNCGLPWSNEETTGTSIILFITPKRPARIQASMYSFNGVRIILDQDQLTVTKIRSTWEQTHRSISSLLFLGNSLDYKNKSEEVSFTDRFPSDSDEYKELTRFNDNICGGTPLVKTYFKFRRNEETYRVWDPQEDCTYEAILSKYFNRNKSKSANFIKQIKWPITVEFGAVGTTNQKNEYAFGKRGKFFIPVSGRFQGFRYSIFIDRKSIKAEFDMTSLLEPFERVVWLMFLTSMVLLYFVMKVSSKSIQLFWIFSVLLEQGEGQLQTKLRKSLKICLLAIVWQLSAIQLRLSYTGNMFSAITAERVPPMPEKMSELFKQPNLGKFDIFSPEREMTALIFENWGNAGDNITFEQLFSSVKGLHATLLREFINPQKESSSFFVNPEVKHNKFPRIALIAYTHPYKLQTADPPKWSGEKENKTWIPPYPFDTIMLTLGQRLLIKNIDRPIRKKLWMFHGKKNFFTKSFARDLNSLVESGIYGRWEAITCRLAEARYIKSEHANLGLTDQWNFHAAACRDISDKLKPPISFRRVSNVSIKVIWVLFLICIGISVAGYLKEVVRFDIPGRLFRCGACGATSTNVKKYKRE